VNKSKGEIVLKRTHRFEIRDTFTRGSTGLRAQQTLLLEDERRPDEETTEDSQDYADDFET
jgi:hypothetical protein